MKYAHLFLVGCFLMVGCAVKNKRDVGARTMEQDGSFEDFFVQFSRDSIFQKSRIKFPLKYSSFGDYSDSLMVDRIEVKDWNYIDFQEDSLAYKNNEDAYQVSFDKKNDRVEYLRKGIDNGINMNFIFKRTVSQWFLTEIVDKSN